MTRLAKRGGRGRVEAGPRYHGGIEGEPRLSGASRGT
jgi:hypothetical protein